MEIKNTTEQTSNDRFQKQRAFWLKKLSGNIGWFGLPYKIIKDKKKIVEYGKEIFYVNTEAYNLLEKLSNGSDMKLYMVLCAVIKTLIFKYSGNRDCIIGAPILKQNIEGEFVNTLLILRDEIETDDTFKELLLKTRSTVVESYENCNYPLTQLLSQAENGEQFRLGSIVLLKNIHDESFREQTQADLVFSFLKNGGSIELVVEYNTQHYDESIINALYKHFEEVIKIALNNIDTEISSIDILSDTEKQKFNLYNESKAGVESELLIAPQKPDKENQYEPFPLTPVQMAYLMGRGEEFEIGGVSTHFYMEIETKGDISRLNSALKKVIERQPALRTVVYSNATQRILEDVPEYNIEIIDICDKSQAEIPDYVLSERDRMSHHVFKTDCWPLFEIKALKISRDAFYLFIGFDMLIADAASLHMIGREIMSFYQNPDCEVSKMDFTFRDYINAYTTIQKSAIYKRDKEYWLNKIADFPAAPSLPMKQQPSCIKKPKFNRVSKMFERAEWEAFKKKAQSKNVTPSVLLCTIYAELLAFWSNSNHLAINMTTFNRYPFHEDVNQLIGDFTSVILLDVELKPGQSVWENAKHVHSRLIEALEHKSYEGVEFISELSKYNNMGTSAAMPIVFSSIMYDSNEPGWTDLGDVKMAISQTSQVFIDNQVMQVDGGLMISWDHVEQLFSHEVINTMFQQYIKGIKNIIEGKDENAYRLSGQDRDLIIKYNNTKEDIVPTTLHELFIQQANKLPGNLAVKLEEESFSYKELNEKSNQIACYLREQGIKRNDLIGVLAERCPLTIANIMGILKAGGAYVPINPEHPEERKNYILENSQCKMLLEPEFYKKGNLSCYPVDDLSVVNTPDDLAYIIYTSGSTGKPKGVVITHGAVTNTIVDINQKFKVSEADKIIGLSSMCFDLSVYDIFGALSTGATLVMIPDVRDIHNVIEVVKKEKITVWNSVPAIMDMAVENMESKEGEEVSFWQVGHNSGMSIEYDTYDSLRLVMLSGDWIPLVLPDRIREKFLLADVVSLGGATEASIWSIYYPVGEVKKEWKSIPYGIPLANQEFYVLNYELAPCPVGVQGELYIGGIGVAKEYMNDAEKTGNSFIMHPEYGRLYRTGDYGVMHQDGYIEFLGRKDHQVKIRGHRIELGEIESSLLKHENIKNAVVVDLKDKNGKIYLCAYVVSVMELNVQELKSHLANYVPEYMIPSYFVNINEIPLTPNGKVNRKQLPVPDEANCGTSHEYIAPSSPVEIKLAQIWKEVLGVEKIGVNDVFLELGGDSVMMVRTVARVEEEFKVHIGFRDFLLAGSLGKVAKLVVEGKNNQVSVKESENIITENCIDQDNLHEPFPLTEVQMAYFVGRNSGFEMGGISTHGYYEIETKLDMELLNKSFSKVIKRQHMLRAIVMPNGEQKILESVPEYTIEIRDVSHLSTEEQESEILKERERMSHYVFKTDEWPLFELKALKISENVYYLFVGFDLLISDGTSTRILIKDILENYSNPNTEVPPLKFTFRDYINAYHQMKQSDIYNTDKNYWLGKLADFPSAPALPLKNNPADIIKPHFQRYSKAIEKSEWETIKRKAQEHNITPSALLCTAFAKVLAFWSNQPHLAINLTVFNRYPFHKDVNGIIGDFTSVMLVEVDLKTGTTFWENSQRVQGTLMEALEHRQYDGIEFIREISKYNNMGSRAVMPIVFTSMLFSMDKNEKSAGLSDLGDIKMGISQTSQVFLDYQVWENEGGILISWDYVEELFEEELIGTMFKQYIEILLGIAYEKCSLLSAGERDITLIRDYNKTKEDIKPATLNCLVDEQVKGVPNNIAVVFENERITYEELNRRSNQIAHYLREQGIGPDKLVGVVAKRRIETIINLVGILKAGGAYVPIDPDYPEERKKYIYENSSCCMLLTPNSYEENGLSSYSDENLANQNSPDDLAYIIYTSGSTGKPKGVVITHGAVTNTIIDINQKFKVNEADKIIGLSSMCFDLSVYDIFGALSTGATLVMIPDVRDIHNAIEVVKKEKITIWNSVPAIMDMTVENMESKEGEEVSFWQVGHNSGMSIEYDTYDSLRLVMLSGDWIPLSLPDRIREKFLFADVVSLGGATEASIWSIYYPVREVKKEWKSIPYGIPLANQEFYVLNYEMAPCPVGVQGELYIGGIGVAKEYMNDEEKTRNSFIMHPEYGRLYRTGDYGVMHQDGYIDFLGRKDHQVKIRGHRIELGEIESSLLKHNSIRKAVVIDRSDNRNKKYLCAYIVADGEVKSEDLKEHLGKDLPEYMIPTYFISINDIPLTPNGKVNRKELPEPDESVLKSIEYITPRNSIEEKLADIWKKVLEVDNVSMNDNFFNLGGDSIRAVRMHSILQNDFDISIRNIFEYQTIESMAQNLKVKKNSFKDKIAEIKQRYIKNKDKVVPSAMEYPGYASYAKQAENDIKNGEIFVDKSYKNILVTGGTGYLGSHIICEFLKNSQANIFACVRGQDQENAVKRLKGKLDFYFGNDFYESNKDRIIVINGDVCKGRLDLDQDVYSELTGTIDCIINSAATVAHFGRYEEFQKTNIESVANLIDFAKDAKVVDFYHISSSLVASGVVENIERVTFTEFDYNVGQEIEDFYSKSKFEAEKLVFEARKYGINANILRIGNIAFNSNDGTFQENIEQNAFYQMVNMLIKLKAIPGVIDNVLEFSFIDCVSKAIYLLTSKIGLQNQVFHITNQNKINLNLFAEMLRSLQLTINTMEYGEFLDYLLMKYEENDYKQHIENTLIHSQLFVLHKETHYDFVSDRTDLILKELGFEWVKPQSSHIKHMIEFGKKMNFFNV